MTAEIRNIMLITMLRIYPFHISICLLRPRSSKNGWHWRIIKHTRVGETANY
jgi:hypothetical protein